jgi:hypothetical protein
MRISISIFFVIFLYGCIATKSQVQTDRITAINYIVKLPLVQGDRQYFDFVSTIPIYYYQDLIVYQLPYTYDSTKVTYHIKADTISDEHVLTETRYNYFVYRQGSSIGIWYRSMEQLDSAKQLSIDSILKRVGPPTNLQSIIYSPNDSLVERTTLDNGNTVIEKYIPKTKPDESYNDTTLLYYSKALKSIKFSLSPFFDSLTNTKLYKLRLAFNESYSPKYSITMPQRDIVYEIVKVDLANPIKLKSLFERFKQDEKNFF